jgi:hypothetical protein
VRGTFSLSIALVLIIDLMGYPRVNAVKGTWQGDHAFVIDRLILGLGQPPERATLTFFGEKLNVLISLTQGRQILIDGETGG